ncbi:MAG TPA: hypothetical protein VEA44_14855 [Caulobacter sp.]|nr:hypothetical protein [Caulobacter sp.]
MTDSHSAREDLAYLKTLLGTDSGGEVWRFAGRLFAVGGLLYGLQCLFHGAQILGVEFPGPVTLAAMFGPTVLFLVYMTVAIVRGGRAIKPQGTTGRAVDAIFNTSGLINLVLLVIFLPPAIQSGDFKVWLFYPAVVFAVLGGAWFAAWQLRRRLWMLGTALGWMVSAGLMGLTRGQPAYLLICGLALFLFMMLPGVAMARGKAD